MRVLALVQAEPDEPNLAVLQSGLCRMVTLGLAGLGLVGPEVAAGLPANPCNAKVGFD